jgi:hypothetical protein
LESLQFAGGWHPCIPVPDDLDAEYHREHGTIYIFHGRSEDDNTFPLQGSNPRSMIQYLNRRYFRLPLGVKIQMMDPPADKALWPTRIEDCRSRSTHGTQMYNVHGTEYSLKKYSVFSGVLALTEGNLHWYTFGDASKVIVTLGQKPGDNPKNNPVDVLAHQSSKTGSAEGVGHGFTGILYRDEIYDRSKAKNALIRFVEAGIYSTGARKRLVFLFEPNTDLVQPNAARSRLRYRGLDRDIPWGYWMSQLTDRMSPEIKAIIDESQPEIGGNLEQDIHKRLDGLKDMVDWDRFSRPGRATKTREGKKGAHNSDKPEDEHRRTFPAIRQDNEPNPDSPAYYAVDNNTLILYTNSDRFKKMFGWYQQEWGGDTERDSIISGAILRVFGEECAQRIVVARSLRTQAHYSNQDTYSQLIGPQAMDITLCGLLTLDMRIRQILSGTLGAKQAI